MRPTGAFRRAIDRARLFLAAAALELRRADARRARSHRILSHARRKTCSSSGSASICAPSSPMFPKSGEDERTGPGQLGDPQFELALSGWYWQITRLDGEAHEIKASRSLFAARLPKLSDLRVPAETGGVRRGVRPGAGRAHAAHRRARHRCRRHRRLSRAGRGDDRGDGASDRALSLVADGRLLAARHRARARHRLSGALRPASAAAAAARIVAHPPRRARRASRAPIRPRSRRSPRSSI